MDLELRILDNDHLSCRIAHGEEHAEFICNSPADSIRVLGEALDELTLNGCAECLWEVPSGDYRWLFRQEGPVLRVVILWSAGVMTGWEHLFFAEGPCMELYESLRAAAQAGSATL